MGNFKSHSHYNNGFDCLVFIIINNYWKLKLIKMKKLLFVFMMLINLMSMEAQSIKGYTLGEKLVGSSMKETTVGGIPMILTALTLNDGTIYQVIGISGKDYNRYSDTYKIGTVYISDVKRLAKAFDINYGISMTKDEDGIGNFLYDYFTDKTAYIISAESTGLLTSTYKLSVILTDINLAEINKIQEANNAVNDL